MHTFYLFTTFMTKQEDLGETDLEAVLFMPDLFSQKLPDGISSWRINCCFFPVLFLKPRA